MDRMLALIKVSLYLAGTLCLSSPLWPKDPPLAPSPIWLSGNKSTVYGVAVCGSGDRVATVCFDHTFRLWNSADGKLLSTQSAITPLWCVAEQEKLKRIAAGGEGVVFIYSTDDGKEVHRI